MYEFTTPPFLVFLNTKHLAVLLTPRDAAWISVSNSGYSPHEPTWTSKLNSGSSASTGPNHQPWNMCVYWAMLQKQFNYFVKKK